MFQEQGRSKERRNKVASPYLYLLNAVCVTVCVLDQSKLSILGNGRFRFHQGQTNLNRLAKMKNLPEFIFT